MSLSPILKYIYAVGSEEVIRRGKKIFLTGGVQWVKKDEFSGQVTFRVRNDLYYNQYQVHVSRYRDEQTLQTRCSCPYNLGEICRHEAAALFQLNELINSGSFDGSQTNFQQKHTVIRMRDIDLKSLKLYTSSASYEKAGEWIQQRKATILQAANDQVEAELDTGEERFHIRLRHHDDHSFDTSCTCIETRHALCWHKTALFLQILNHQGSQYFQQIRNWEHQKNKLLALYGYSLQDDLQGKFDFHYEQGRPILRVLDPSIKKLERIPVVDIVAEPQGSSKRMGLVLQLQPQTFPYFRIEVVSGEPLTSGLLDHPEKIELQKPIPGDSLHPDDMELLQQARKVQAAEYHRYLARNSPFGDLWENIHQHENAWSPENQLLLYEYLHPRLSRLFSSLKNHNPLYLLENGKPFRARFLQPVHYMDKQARPLAYVKRAAHGSDIHLQTFVEFGDGQHTPGDNSLQSHLLFLHEGQLHLIHEARDAAALDILTQHAHLQAADWKEMLEQTLLPLSRRGILHFGDDLVEHRRDELPRHALHLDERNGYLLLQPVFLYAGREIPWNEEISTSWQEDGKLIMLHRNREAEQAFVSWLQQLHPHLRPVDGEFRFALQSRYVLDGQWFFHFTDLLKEKEILVSGYDTLKQFRLVRARPQTRVQIASQLDWFDTRVDVQFENQVVPLQVIQQALAQKQTVVPLPDGQYGLLPDDWVKRFSLLFKMGDSNGESLRVSKFHFTVIDELYDLIEEEDIRKELEAKRDKLLHLQPTQFSDTPVPPEVQATLRPYQEAGFQWLIYLNRAGWGGLLADDMGLGKTLQTLAFLQFLKNEQGYLHALVICPTTLLYNWENEIRKFTPSLTYLIHHGPQRTIQPDILAGYDLVISTYGTLRSDVTLFRRYALDYIVLDESQTIKNPGSKVAKAAQVLPCKNRIALSGTPMQNNTFDLFSQMHFLNPGMLGSKEFFKDQFAKPVDKFQDEEIKLQLRKLIYPFLLRRTKEQVARDLPDKTEITLLCEMGEEQRAVYEQYRELYRSRILDTIDRSGMDKSRFAILQGLMRLRQICDSPAILRDASYPNHSIKLDELLRELEENTGQHKVLVFSQFLGMLALIREKLQAQGIAYQYFDGSYSARQREAAIQEFQQNEQCMVFLISLKAGGMGLNLTAADYVYLMDPWWNPAVEQQAIDRTHRIGQTKNIFAYRYICRNTVEEKIMQLKERKNLLVKDLVADDQHMIKQLTREDVVFLFD